MEGGCAFLLKAGNCLDKGAANILEEGVEGVQQVDTAVALREGTPVVRARHACVRPLPGKRLRYKASKGGKHRRHSQAAHAPHDLVLKLCRIVKVSLVGNMYTEGRATCWHAQAKFALISNDAK